MKSSTLIALMTIVILSSCRKPTNPNSHFADGFCLTSGCACEEGYTGDECDLVLTPTAIHIESIEITSLPTFDNGESWDPYEGSPDVTFTLRHMHEEVYASDKTYEDAETDHRLLFDDLNITLDGVKDEYKLRILDLDPEDKSQEIIKDLYFTPYGDDQLVPDVIHVSEGSAQVDIHVTYVYE